MTSVVESAGPPAGAETWGSAATRGVVGRPRRKGLPTGRRSDRSGRGSTGRGRYGRKPSALQPPATHRSGVVTAGRPRTRRGAEHERSSGLVPGPSGNHIAQPPCTCGSPSYHPTPHRQNTNTQRTPRRRPVELMSHGLLCLAPHRHPLERRLNSDGRRRYRSALKAKERSVALEMKPHLDGSPLNHQSLGRLALVDTSRFRRTQNWMLDHELLGDLDVF